LVHNSITSLLERKINRDLIPSQTDLYNLNHLFGLPHEAGRDVQLDLTGEISIIEKNKENGEIALQQDVKQAAENKGD